jgi:hypothetical protein
LYRTAEGKRRTKEGKEEPVGGVPLATANDAVVAAVRLAYKVAEGQVQRSLRMAHRLREAGDKQVGGPSDEKALDAAERLVQKTLMSGLEWWEASVGDGRCPVKRLVAAEYQMIGTLLGLGPAQRAKKPPAGGAQAAGPSPAPAERKDRMERKSDAAMRRLQVVHKGDKKSRRAVGIEAWEIAATRALQTTVFFYSADPGKSEPIEAELTVPGKDADIRLTIATPPALTPGRWKCAVCDDADVQVGFIEISL